ncbi:neutral zinc metallopeptidase [Nocardia cyriacigeorgica]|uniref:Predicted metalloprotease n=1 Tax=Nocardia cyriacigeorgica TaxID=135487 RepID=A0A4V6ICU0_9NOCA|nr:neutral zinc metallopeptidase [Nocardia cyriacigeorgica]VFB00794.1 Predicted metalloprotease [Nocardia cyriacigeorgica]
MPYGRPLPPPRSGGGGVAAVFTVLGVFIVVGLLVAAGFAASSSDSSTTSYTSPNTPSYTYSPSPTTYSSSPTTTSRPPSTTAGSTTTRRTTTSTTPAGPKPVAALATNPIFAHSDTGLINITCGYPTWAPNLAAAQAFFDAASDCLGRMWSNLLAYENLPFSPPTVNVTATMAEATSPCTGGVSGNWAAYYCSANKAIYMPMEAFMRYEDPYDSVTFLAVFAHEYAHHVEFLTGIMGKAHDDRYDAGLQSPVGLEISRRLELNAQCFGGMFIGSSAFVGTISGADAEAVVQDNYGRGDKAGDMRDHGSKQNYGAWYEHGYRNNRAQMCNTWAAPSDAVA